MFTIRQSKIFLISLSAAFTLTLLIFTSNIYMDNFPQLLGSKAASCQKEIPLKESDVRLHIVKIGESLADISKKYYGSPHYIETIYEANKPLISTNDLEPGKKLIIPSFP